MIHERPLRRLSFGISDLRWQTCGRYHFRTMSGFRGLLASPSISLALLLASALPADALDPNLKLSQYIHRIWQTQPNLPQADFYSLGQTTDGYLLLGTQT